MDPTLAHPTTCNDARRLETRVKERTSHLPPAIEEETRRKTPPGSRGEEEERTEAKEREAIEPIRTRNVDQRNRENPGEKPPSPSRRARRGAKSRIAPPRATRVRAGYTRQKDRRIPESESPTGTGDRNRASSRSLLREGYERENEEEREALFFCLIVRFSNVPCAKENIEKNRNKNLRLLFMSTGALLFP
ncbi:LOW QUALITY PROTEIN: hypothetical protein HID58_021230 [Brassica napus]|uniref:Uncharacterized protein n=1 Tax=Brassica napus TaxID=3708 RepID=A0ABQ8CVT6_BRANA|nr:LOW QUALITY PROTEIN: hypothetical protein HID58_021230 [Brassica napus]